MITGKDYSQRDCTLMFLDGVPVQRNSTIFSNGGDKYRIIGGIAPHKPSSTGKVWARRFTENGELSDSVMEFYPTVFGLQWRLDAEQPKKVDPAIKLLQDILALDSNQAYADDTGLVFWKQAMSKARELARGGA